MKSRYFTYNDDEGFPGELDYIEINPDQNVIFHNKDKSINEHTAWSAEGVLEIVNKGAWKEIFNKKSAAIKWKLAAKVKKPKVKAKPKAYFHFINVGGKWDFRSNIDAPIRIYIQSGQYNYKGDAVRAAKKLCERMGYEYNSF